MTREGRSAIIPAMETSDMRVEHAARENDGLSVTLVWDPTPNLLAVIVVDRQGQESFEVVVEPDAHPLEVFYHPYAAAAARGLELSSGGRSPELAVDWRLA